jgi:hypothetical protein
LIKFTMNVMILFNRAVLPSFEFGCPKIKVVDTLEKKVLAEH